jgi:TonB-dependent SusC/RagA subfamily outer membrane receptor
MPALLIYLLKANIALTLFYLAYRLGLRRLTFYVLNRFFLLTGIVCASVFPLIDVNALLQRHQQIVTVVEYVPDLSALQAQAPAGITIWHLLVYIFWTGVTVMGIRFLMQLLSLWRIHHKAHTIVIQQQPVKMLDRPLNPFSFFRNIYINPSLHPATELDAILQHEQVHVKEWHTIDVLVAELNNIFYWFNPGAWLMRTAIRENLEFITDRRMLQQGVDPKAYQYNLVKVSGIPYATAIANNFNFSHLKNRIKMMNRKRSAKYNILRYLVLGSVVVIALLSLNFSRAAFNHKHLTLVTDTVPAPPVAPVEPVAHIMPPTPTAPIAPPTPVAAVSPVGGVTPPTPPPAPVATPQPVSAPTPVPPPPPLPKHVPRAIPAPQPLPEIDTVPPAVDVLVSPNNFKGLVFVDGVKSPGGIPASLKPDDIVTMNVLKGESALATYGEAGSNGVILITTKKGTARLQKTMIYTRDSVKVKSGVQVKVRNVVHTNTNVNPHINVNPQPNVIVLRGVDSLKQPLIVVNGKVTTLAELHAIPKDKIKTINVSSGKGTSYSEKSTNGVIEVQADTFYIRQ